MLKLRTGFIAVTLIASLAVIPMMTFAQETVPDVQLSDVKWEQAFTNISGARFSADKSGRAEDDYFGYPGSRSLPPEEYGTAPPLPLQTYYLTAKVTNHESRAIRSITWETTYFEDAAKTRKLGCRRGILTGIVSPGKTATLRQHLAARKFKNTLYSTTNLLRIDYRDDSAWVSSDRSSIKRGDRQACGS